ncbi:hypothetical protein RHMOL_Rhmol11G0268700 [Rhododendron molle]|uniref:Uncharacterized protein n=1 Tax=Rhododendron molle TaxID=49168 RepID=A0ACC0LYD1_RHOML|nr:hypothetical protein RHMOL_Rhmol11G0268700 [Rhododendron molle]
MNDEVANTGKLIRKYVARIIVSVVAMFMLLWTIYIGYDFATKPHRDGKYNRYALSIGAATIVLGITFVTIGLAIVSDLALNFTSRQQREKRIEIEQDGAAGTHTKRIVKDIARFIVTVISILLLTWAIYDGIRLATAPGQDGKIDHLAFPVGVVTIAFGTIYFIIGLSIVADLAVNLSSVLKRHEDKKEKQEEDIHNSCHDDNNTSINV